MEQNIASLLSTALQSLVPSTALDLVSILWIYLSASRSQPSSEAEYRILTAALQSLVPSTALDLVSILWIYLSDSRSQPSSEAEYRILTAALASESGIFLSQGDACQITIF